VKQRAPMSITLRLALLFSAVAVATFTAAGAYLYQTLAMQMAGRDDTELLGKVELVRHLLRDIPSLESLQKMPRPLLDTVYGQDGMTLRVTGPDGKLLLQNAEPGRPLPTVPQVPATREPVMNDIHIWDVESGRGRVLSAQAQTSGGLPVQVTIARERSDRLKLLTRYAIDLSLAVCIGAALATLFGFIIVRQGMRPLRAVIGKANDISTQRLNTRLAVGEAPAELRELGNAFNAMLDRLEDGVQRLSGFAADLAHDLRTPVNTLMVETQVALSRPRSNEEYQALLASNIEEYERLSRMIENTLFLARVDNAQMGLHREELDAGKELRRIGEYFEGLAEDAGVALRVNSDAAQEVDGAAVVRLEADPILLQRAVSNLVSNAIQHTPEGGMVELCVRDTARGVQVSVSNTGPGIAPEHMNHIFGRYYRADPARSASSHSAGLGLAIVRAIMTLHGGAIEAHSTPGERTTFLLQFPAHH
jgi:two-component system heavy metal sensor histidine kinase CusS